jgi:hypothetical protein
VAQYLLNPFAGERRRDALTNNFAVLERFDDECRLFTLERLPRPGV